MTGTAEDWVLLLARLCLASVFLVSGIHKGIWREQARREFRDVRAPWPDVTLTAVVILHLVAPMALILGIYTQWASLSLAVFLVLVTVWVHDFWNQKGQARLESSRNFLANLSILGGLLAFAVIDPGALALG